MKVFAWICAGLMALAVIPAYADSGCSEKHEQVSRFNPTELSDYQKCVHKFYGNEFGTVGKYVWMQHNNDFIYVPLNKLQNKSILGIQEVIVDEAIAHEIEAIEKEITKIETVIKYVEDGDVIKGLRDRIDRLKIQASVVAEHIKWAAGSTTGTISSGRVTITDPNGNTMGYSSAEFRGGYINNYNKLGKAVINLAREVAATAYAKGYDDGYSDGYAAGYVAGYNAAHAELNR